jgi:hypothetical protein
MERELLQHIQNKINEIDVNKLFDGVRLNGLIDISSLIILVESLYYSNLINNKEANCQLLNFLEMLKGENSDNISELSYLFMIYMCDKIMKQSQNNMYM